MKRIITTCFSVMLLCLTAYAARHDTRGRSVTADSLFREVAGLSDDDMLRMADSVLEAGNQEEALSVYLIVGHRRSSSTDSLTVAKRVRGYVGAGDIMMRRCDYAAALDNYIQALIVSEDSPSRPMEATINKNIGNVYCCLNDYETGIGYYKKGLEICREHPDPEVEKKILANLSGMITYTDDPVQAEKYREMSRRLYPPVTDEEIYLDMLLDGLLLKSRKQYGQAAAKFRETAAYAVESGIEPRYQGAAYQELYATYLAMNMPDSAIVYMQRCRGVAERNGLEMMFPSVYDALSDFYTAAGNPDKAREFRSRYFDIRDSIMNDREFNAVKNVLFQYKASQTADEIRSLYHQKDEKELIIKRQRTVLLSVIAGLCLLCGALLFFYIQKRRIMRSYRSLYEIDRANTRVREALDERHKEDVRMLDERDKEISRLRMSLAGASQRGCISSEEPMKYSTSNLRDIHRNRLAEAITAVMENNHEELCNPDFSLERLAKIVGSNSKYVSQTINEEFNKNFSNYVNYYRVKLACDRLADRSYDSYKLKYIGESVGFKSYTTFTEVFRKHIGLSPSVYRKMALSEGEGD